MFGINSMLWVTENTMQLLGPKNPTTSDKHVQTSPISAELKGDKELDEKNTESILEDEVRNHHK
jgi:hypothetical protein